MELDTDKPSSSSSSAFLGRLRRRNSLLDTKVLFTRSDSRWPVQQPKAEEAREPSEFSFHDHFDWDEHLGAGSFADVYAVRHKRRPAERYAIKCYKSQLKSRAERAALLKEAELANELEPHPNVVTYYRVWQEASTMYVQMELCEQGSLRDQMIVDTLSVPSGDAVAWTVLEHVSAGLAHIHALGMIHCDVKPGGCVSPPRSLRLATLLILAPCYALPPSHPLSVTPMLQMDPDE